MTPNHPAPASGAALRLLQPADAPAYTALRQTMLRQFPEAFTSDPDAEPSPDRHAQRLSAGPAGFTLGVFVEHRLAGALTCERPTRAKERHLGHLVAMMVDPAHQGTGLGGRLLAAVIDRARAGGDLLQLTLSVTRGNEAAMALYRRAGFVSYGCLPRAVRLADGRLLAKELMVLALDDG